MLAALAAVPRSGFVPPDSLEAVDADLPVPLPCDQTTSQPSLVALMVEALRVGPDDRVLEIGTGYGFEAAVLSRLAAQVWSVEWFDHLAEAASANLARFGADNVHVVTGDGRRGLPEHAPFDAVVVAARADDVPSALADQVADGGRVVLPLGPAGQEECVVLVKRAGRLERAGSLGPVRFVPLQGE